MASNEIEVRGLQDLAKVFDQLPGELRLKALRPALRKAAELIQHEAQRLAPHKTGMLADSIHVQVKVDPSSNSGYENYATVKAGDRKAHLLEFGTAAHKIIGKLKYSVMKLTKPDGKKRRWRRVGITDERNVLASPDTVFGRSVKHPGSKARPFLRPALDSMHIKAITTFADELRNAIIRVVKNAVK